MKHIANTSKRRLIAGAVLASAGDVLTTGYALGVMGLVEQNPLAAGLMAEFGLWPALIGSKLVVLGFMLIGMRLLDDYERGLPLMIIGLYGAVTVLNLIEILFV